MQNMPIGIFRGDDTDAFGCQTIVGTIKTDLDLTGCKAVFRYLGFSVEFDPIPEDKKLTVIIPASETKKFPPGLGYASLRVYDSDGRLKTFSNRIMVFVATKTPMFGSDEFEVDFNVRASLEPLKFFVGPNPDDFDEYRGYLEKVIDRASASKYGLAILLDAIDSDLGADDGVAATPVAVKAAYAAIIKKLTDDYYTAEETDEAIDRVAAYYITYDAAGNPFPTYAALVSAQTVYSGGKVRIPTRNDYCVVLADETHDNAEYRYIYAVADGETTGSWQPQFPVEGVMTVDQIVTKNSQNPVSGGGVWSAIWGALASLPTGFSSLYDWCVAQLAGKASVADATLTERGFSAWDVVCSDPEVHGFIVYDGDSWKYRLYDSNNPDILFDETEAVWPEDSATSLQFRYLDADFTFTATRTVLQGYRLGPNADTNPNRDKPLASEAEAEALRTGKADKSDVDPLLFAQYYPDGDVKSAAEFTPGLKYNFVAAGRTATVKTFGPTLSGDDNRNIAGRVVIPPFVDEQGNGYVSDDGTRYEVVGVAGDTADLADEYNENLRDVIAPLCVVGIGDAAFVRCQGLETASFPGATRIEQMAFFQSGLNEAVFPAATYVGVNAFSDCSLVAVVLPNVSEVAQAAFYDCSLPDAVVLPSVGRVKEAAFHGCFGFTSIDMPLVKHIEANAFDGCYSLRTVIVPSITGDWSVGAEKSFGDAAFAGCYRLEKVDFGGKGRGQYKIPTLGENVFPDDGKIGKCTFVVPDADRNLWPTATVWKDLDADFYGYMSHSEREYARKYEVDEKADRAPNPTAGNLAALDANGNPTDSTIPAVNVATKVDIPYWIVTKTIDNGAVTLDDRASNIVTISATLSPNTLTINFPPLVDNGMVRDFAMRLNIAAGVTAPEIAWPQGVTLENDGGEMPEIADGGADGSSTILYFGETENDGTTAKFLVKGETLTAIAH